MTASAIYEIVLATAGVKHDGIGIRIEDDVLITDHDGRSEDPVSLRADNGERHRDVDGAHVTRPTIALLIVY